MTRLVLLDGQTGGAQERPLSRPRLVLGRGQDADWSFVDRSVSRQHAVVYHLGDHDEIEDLGSLAGTLVNGTPLHGRRRLRGGDVVQLGSVRLRYANEEPGNQTHTTPTRDQRTGDVSFGIDRQHAGVISNVGRDQYNNYVQHVIVQREDAYRQIASMSRVARWLWIVGFSLGVIGVLGFIGSGVAAMASPDLSNPVAFGVPVFALAMGVALTGMALAFTGLIIQFAASTRRRDVDHRYPLPTDWNGLSP